METEHSKMCETPQSSAKRALLALHASMREKEKSQINNLSFCLKILGNEKQVSPKQTKGKS